MLSLVVLSAVCVFAGVCVYVNDNVNINININMSFLYVLVKDFFVSRDVSPIPGGYRGGVPPLPIPNREVKPACADGTAMQCGRVGSRPLLFTEEAHPLRVRFLRFGAYGFPWRPQWL